MKIRYHHLLCIPRFEGKGYSDDFCRKLAEISKDFNRAEYELVESCDDLCEVCPNNINGVCRDSEKVDRYDKAVRKSVEAGIIPLPHEICSDCSWYYICKNKE